MALVARQDFLSRYWLWVREHWTGPPVARSDPRWLRRVAAGVLALAVTLALLVIWAERKRHLNYWATVPDFSLLAICAGLAGAIGLVTSPERPLGDGAAAGDTQWRSPGSWQLVRRLLRGAGFIPLLAALVAVWSEYVPASEHEQYARAGMLMLVPLPMLSMLLFDYLAYIAARLPSMHLAVQLRLAMLASTALATIAAFAALDSGRGHVTRVPEFVRDVVLALWAGCCPGAYLLVVALVLTLGSRLVFAVERKP